LTTLINQSGWKTGDFYMSLRIAICGSKITPPINETMEILGKEETLSRLKKSLA
jgi:glutamyl-tRNA synthetase